jgi:hypothetical protein
MNTTTKKKAASQKAVSKKAVSKKATAKKAAPKKATRKKAASRKATTISYEDRYQKIAEAAYLMAEEQGFAPGQELRNWLEAEKKIDDWIASSKIKLVK